VRELYAVQVRWTHQTRNATAWGQIRTWTERHTGFDIASDGGTTQQVKEQRWRDAVQAAARAEWPAGEAPLDR